MYASLFLQYLWGIETMKQYQEKVEKNLFLQYLWGIETHNRYYYF